MIPASKKKIPPRMRGTFEKGLSNSFRGCFSAGWVITGIENPISDHCMSKSDISSFEICGLLGRSLKAEGNPKMTKRVRVLPNWPPHGGGAIRGGRAGISPERLTMQSIFSVAARRGTLLGDTANAERRAGALKMDWTEPLHDARPMCIEWLAEG